MCFVIVAINLAACSGNNSNSPDKANDTLYDESDTIKQDSSSMDSTQGTGTYRDSTLTTPETPAVN